MDLITVIEEVVPSDGQSEKPDELVSTVGLTECLSFIRTFRNANFVKHRFNVFHTLLARFFSRMFQFKTLLALL